MNHELFLLNEADMAQAHLVSYKEDLFDLATCVGMSIQRRNQLQYSR
jgi:hypothetical protein